MIPFFSGRAETLWAQLGSRSADENYEELLKSMKKKPIEYFKMFYADTVLGGSASALRCGLDFFGADRVVFASDCPFDPRAGRCSFARESVRSKISNSRRATAQDLLRKRDEAAEDAVGESACLPKKIKGAVRPFFASSENPYLTVAAPALQTTSSCEPVPPEQPIAPMIFPPSNSGMPPREPMTPSRVRR